MKKRQKCRFLKVFVLWEAETITNNDVFEGQVAKNTVIYIFLTQCPKTEVFTRFLATGRHETLVFTMDLAILKIIVKLR